METSDVSYRPTLFSEGGPVVNDSQVKKYAIIYHLLMDYPLETVLVIDQERYWLK